MENKKKEKLPPLPEEAFKDGLSEKITLKFENCLHKDAEIKGNELRCKCGAAWSGHRLHDLHNLLKNR